jgi:hypothetical protein
MIRAVEPPSLEFVEVEGTPEERARALAQEEEFWRNARWFSAHAREIRDKYPGQYICVAGGELFVGDDAVEVHTRARAAHPSSDGCFSLRISTHRGPKIYAHQRPMGGR